MFPGHPGEKEADMRRLFVVVLAAVATLLTAVLPVQAASDSDVVEQYHRLQAVGRVILTPEGGMSVGPIEGTEEIVNLAGEVIDRVPFKAGTAAARPLGQGIANIPCVHDTEPQGFTAYTPPVSYSIDKKNEKGLFKFHFYDIDQARENHLGQPTVQFLMCAAGGVDAGNGSRIRVSGPGMTFNDPNASHILGTRWKEGKTPEDYSITLGFEAPLRGATVKGSIRQHPSNSLKGSISPPYSSGMSEFHENAVNAWWEDGCRPRCTRWGGSNNYQGSVAEGLWEFPQSFKGEALRRSWLVTGYLEHHCSNPFGC